MRQSAPATAVNSARRLFGAVLRSVAAQPVIRRPVLTLLRRAPSLKAKLRALATNEEPRVRYDLADLSPRAQEIYVTLRNATRGLPRDHA
jgi:hypothetical protein